MTIANANIGSAFELFEVDEDVLMDRACKYLLVEEGELINTPLAFFSIKKHKQKKGLSCLLFTFAKQIDINKQSIK